MEKMVKLGWYALMIAMAGDILVSLMLPCFYKEYSSMKMSISALGNPQSPVRILFNIWMLIEGILFLAAIPALYRRYHSVSGGITDTMIVFIAVFAIGACIFTCFFSVNESKDIVTAASKIHGAGSVIGFMLFLFVPLLMAVLSFKDKESGMGIACIICFVIALIFFVLFVMSDKPEFSDTVINNEGLWERLNLVFMYLPLLAVSVRQIIRG
ncbi:MAG: DUF998 domain-containing protein [Lachnospiraceae bacterium]|nr:DUF998 domain-containing protein [Lachnospiraceae bacterium]